MRAILRVQLAGVRTHAGRHLAMVLAVGAATTTVVAALVAFTSIAASADRLGRLAGAADLEIAARSSAGIDEQLARSVALVDGVRGAVPLVTAPSTLVAHDGMERDTLLLGIDVRGAALGDALAAEIHRREAQFATTPGRVLHGVFLTTPLARALGVAVGDEIDVKYAATRSLEVLGTIDPALTAGVNDGEVAVVLRPVAQDLLGRPGRVDSIAVVGGDDVDPADIAALVDPDEAVVRSTAARARAIAADIAPFSQALLLVAATVLGVGGTLVFQVVTITREDDRRSGGLLRIVGATRRSVVAATALVSGGLCLVGGSVGAAAGAAVGPAAIARLPAFLTAVSSLRVSPSVPVAAVVLLAVAAGMVGAAVGAGAALHDPSPVETLGSRPTPTVSATRRTGVLVGGLAATATGIWLAAAVGVERLPEGLLTTLLLGGAILVSWGTAPVQVGFAAAVADRLGRHPRAGWQVRSEPRRAWAVMTALCIPLALGVALGGLGANGTATTESTFGSYRDVPALLRTTEGSRPSTGRPLPLDLVARLADHVLARERWESLELDAGRVVVVAVDEGSHHPLVAHLDAEAMRAVQTGRGVVLGSGLAGLLGVDPGDRVAIPTPGGRWPLTVVAVEDVVLSVENRVLGVGFDAYEGHFGRSNPQVVELDAVPSADVGAGVQLISGAQVVDIARDGVRDTLAVFDLLRVLATATASVVVAGTLTLTILGRRQTLTVVRALGATTGDLVRSVAAMAIGLAVPAIIASWIIGAALQFSLVAAARDLTGFPFRFAFAPASVIRVTASGLVAIAAGAVVPAWVMARRATAVPDDRAA